MSLKQCRFVGCTNLEDPRWGGYCDGHGVTSELEWRARAEQEHALMEEVRVREVLPKKKHAKSHATSKSTSKLVRK